MFSKYLKTLSILKKFLFINFVIFTIIGLFKIVYINSIQTNIVKEKYEDQSKIKDITINNIKILNWLNEESKKRNLPFVRTVAKLMVQRAINKSRRIKKKKQNG